MKQKMENKIKLILNILSPDNFEKKIKELRDRGIIIRKPLRKDVRKKLKLKNLSNNMSEKKSFVDRPSTPPNEIRYDTSRPVFFNDAETMMSNGSDIE